MADPRQPDPWDLKAQERDRRLRWAATTPADRLHWLEQAIRFAARAGALPRERPPARLNDAMGDPPGAAGSTRHG